LIKLFDRLNSKQDIDIDDFFFKADNIAWSALIPANFEFVKPGKQEVEPRHVCELIEFKIAPTPSSLGENFLFKHKASYLWTLELEDPHTSKRKIVTEQRTNEPRVVQYAPTPGTYYMKVTLEHNGVPAEHPPAPFGPFEIDKSREYRLLSVFRFTETAALAIAALFALITGMGTYYVGKPAFGSITDYITLFIWGAGVDQAKSFLQQLGKTSATG
jgi:hypothetical protein